MILSFVNFKSQKYKECISVAFGDRICILSKAKKIRILFAYFQKLNQTRL